MNTEFPNQNPFEKWLQNKRETLLTELDVKYPGFLNLLTSGLDLVTQKHGIETPKPYHNTVHTFFVLQNVIDMYSVSQREPGLAHESLTQREIALVLVAAAFHDVVIEGGKPFGYNEDESARLVEQKLRAGNMFTEEDISIVSELIKSTKTEVTEQGIYRGHDCNPEDERIQMMRKYIQDADLANLGNNNFIGVTKDLADEWKIIDGFSRYLMGQINILQNFSYNTQAARYLFPFMERNLIQILEFVNSYTTDELTYDNFVSNFNLN